MSTFYSFFVSELLTTDSEAGSDVTLLVLLLSLLSLAILGNVSLNMSIVIEIIESKSFLNIYGYNINFAFHVCVFH